MFGKKKKNKVKVQNTEDIVPQYTYQEDPISYEGIADITQTFDKLKTEISYGTSREYSTEELIKILDYLLRILDLGDMEMDSGVDAILGSKCSVVLPKQMFDTERLIYYMDVLDRKLNIKITTMDLVIIFDVLAEYINDLLSFATNQYSKLFQINHSLEYRLVLDESRYVSVTIKFLSMPTICVRTNAIFIKSNILSDNPRNTLIVVDSFDEESKERFNKATQKGGN